MPKPIPKKREKDKEPDCKQNVKIETTDNDHEQFLQAFEKPTQIYRYLRTRNMLKPVFLYRTLTYMKHRNSRTNKRRKLFKVDSILQTVMSRSQNYPTMSGYLTLTFLGFYNKLSAITSKEEPVKVETLLLKICHKKRKDVSCPVMTVSLGTSYVPFNPSDEFPPPKSPTVCIPTESFSLSGHLVKSYHLLLRVASSSPGLFSIGSEGESEPNSKKKKLSKEDEKVIVYGTDLVIYDKQNRCLLSDGEYEFYLEQIPITNGGNKIAHALSTWEEIGFEKEFQFKDHVLPSFEKMSSGPLLKVRLQWSREPVTAMVDRPLPLLPADKMDTNNKDSSRSDLVKGREKQPVIYQFLYNNNSKQQTEASYDMHCPWCTIDCRSLYSLLKHLKLCHPRFNFTYVPTQGGARIDVSLNEGYDGSFCGAPGGVSRGGGPVRRTPLSHIIVCHPRRPHPALTEFLHMDENEFDAQRPYITGHNRLYHHTTTCLPIYPKEMDIDSEDETDPIWLQKKTKMMIDEFTDVNEGEKELMKMWNLHVMKYGFVGDCQIPLSTTMFLQQKGEELLSKNLYRNFVLHMCNLFDFGLISPVTVYTTIQKLQEMIGVEDTKILQNSALSQREAWRDYVSKAPPAVNSRSQQVDSGQRRKPSGYSSDSKKSASNRRSPSPLPPPETNGTSKKRKAESSPAQPPAKRRLSLPNRPELRRKTTTTVRDEIPLRRRSLTTNVGPGAGQETAKKKPEPINS